MYFKRKAYDKLLEWKKLYSEKYAVLLEGARRVGKSTMAETFAKNEYRSYESVMCRGKAMIIEDIKEKCKALGVLMKVQTGKEHEIDDKMASAVNVVKIDVESYTAKACIR